LVGKARGEGVAGMGLRKGLEGGELKIRDAGELNLP